MTTNEMIPELKPSDEYYILSLDASRGEMLVWWCPKNSGYTSRLEKAGRYSRADVERERGYYHNGDHTLAIPCTDVDALSIRIVPNDNNQLADLTGKWFRMKTDRDKIDEEAEAKARMREKRGEDDEEDEEPDPRGPCSSCGEFPHATNLGLAISGDATPREAKTGSVA